MLCACLSSVGFKLRGSLQSRSSAFTRTAPPLIFFNGASPGAGLLTSAFDVLFKSLEVALDESVNEADPSPTCSMNDPGSARWFQRSILFPFPRFQHSNANAYRQVVALLLLPFMNRGNASNCVH